MKVEPVIFQIELKIRILINAFSGVCLWGRIVYRQTSQPKSIRLAYCCGLEAR